MPSRTPLRVESISGKVLGAERSGKRVTLTYESRGRCYVTLNRKPTTVLCDGAPDLGKVPLNADGFYVEAHMKLRPVDFATEGVFLCGLAHSPKFIDENISQARAAAARAATVLSKTQLDVSAQVSYVDQQKCISCMTCVTVCPYSAPFCNKDGKGQIEAAKCMGCGICAAECPARAIQLHHFETDQFEVMIKQLFAGELSGNGENGCAAPRLGKRLAGKA